MKIIDEKETGKRLIMGTEHPILTQLQRHERFGKVSWTVAGICNGISEWDHKFKNLKDARKDFERP